jgi:formyltetrahydrofolate synthetase
MATTTQAPVKPLLPVKQPVPSDIDIAQSIKPKHISQIAEAGLELRPEEYELYGPSKAKVITVPGTPCSTAIKRDSQLQSVAA